METLQALPQELILDKLTPQQIIQLCAVSPAYKVICTNYWPGRAIRLLRVSAEQWGNPIDPVQWYLTLWARCLPGALDKPLTRACGRAVGRGAVPIEINHYLEQGGNPEDVAYGAAASGATAIVLELLNRYPRFASSIASYAIRGAGSVGQLGTQYLIPNMGDVIMLPFQGAAEVGSLQALRQLLDQVGGAMTLSVVQYLARQGYGNLSDALLPGFRNPLSQNIRKGDWVRIRNYLPGIATSIGALGPASLIIQLLQHAQIDPRIDVQAVLESLYNSDRSDVFVEVANWIERNKLPIDLNLFRDLSREGDDFLLAQWSTSHGN